jgi:hypothetical protein
MPNAQEIRSTLCTSTPLVLYRDLEHPSIAGVLYEGDLFEFLSTEDIDLQPGFAISSPPRRVCAK